MHSGEKECDGPYLESPRGTTPYHQQRVCEGALEYCAAAWLPTVSESHVETIHIELRAGTRVVTACPGGTPRDALMAEAGLAPVRVRRQALADRMKALAATLPGWDPLQKTVNTRMPRRLRTTGWRCTGDEALAQADTSETVVEARPADSIPPWQTVGVHFNLSVGKGGIRSARSQSGEAQPSQSQRRRKRRRMPR